MGPARSSNIHPIQILDANGEGSITSLLCAMEKLIQDGIDYNTANSPKKIRAIVNLSLGVDGRSDVLDEAVGVLADIGYVVVIAAGDNSGMCSKPLIVVLNVFAQYLMLIFMFFLFFRVLTGNACHYSPRHPSAITVGALADDATNGNPAGKGRNPKTSTSNYGSCIDIWAPGEAITGASNEGEFETTTLSGTSVAAAFVSGASTMFLEEVFTDTTSQSSYASIVKEKMYDKAERDVLGDLGHMSRNRMLQTTSSACQSDAHCDAPKKCLYDGVCGILANHFN